MRTLAIDTAGISAGVSLAVDGQIRYEAFHNTGLNHSLVLLPAIEAACRHAGVALAEIDLFALTIGPGSFTGLRIAAGTLKGLALAVGKPVVGVSTLDSLAYPLTTSPDEVLCAMLDAQREQVYAAAYRNGVDGRRERIVPERVADLDELVASLPNGPILFVGDGAERHRDMLAARSSALVRFAGPLYRHVRAAAVALLGEERYRAGESLDVVRFSPRYLRVSEAERRHSSPRESTKND
ncbi:MAG: tRNA (adenosine(37)-N6)-threonylcarbamoyltransferase complex dimerization subunit type 1 TsaB [Syntrophales bacterium]|jgi:tRNA threonylcarbamoyladenosine biosynthesis protein TsaB|nr:tRNA (adenosine(37)-N6)-threonylcarbamoyltransferase complex dimerization subunit type 1 TsaB [Syntrophales bacterium]MDD4338299.1 tRNA (adenosine(37)-N6)-threonylcarbamoyltransferase complex dimerization subunit type 1 TsaB [Syntrophales bacterium]HOG07758.1 tRNA (adenosine(37)-N6)-threonylcarbamoyltransferase complex dimerization subunit type 1 TsaB [Syntrophales bacterium]HOS77444.1 tRNA (adenosine(37)-N6)-threonylcarbamoyltransferase complex dimerization subunit type 1 TsaB [Syntrophales 